MEGVEGVEDRHEQGGDSGVVGALPCRERQEPGPQPHPGRRGCGSLSQAGPAPRQAGVRAFTMVHLAWALGLAIQRRTITAPQPLGQRPPGAGGQEGSRWASGVRFPAWGWGSRQP